MVDKYLEGIMNRDKPDKKAEDIVYPICPLNIYFEGDEDKCDVSKCNFEDRMCTEACKIDVKELQKEIDKIKPQPVNFPAIGTPEDQDREAARQDNAPPEELEVIANVNKPGVYGVFPIGCSDTTRVKAECSSLAFAKELIHRWNSQPKLVEELDDYKEGCKGLKSAIYDLRPYVDCYKRICESLGIEKDILGYVKKLTVQRDNLLYVLEMAENWLVEISKRDGGLVLMVQACPYGAENHTRQKIQKALKKE